MGKKRGGFIKGGFNNVIVDKTTFRNSQISSTSHMQRQNLMHHKYNHPDMLNLPILE